MNEGLGELRVSQTLFYTENLERRLWQEESQSQQR